MWVRRMGSQRKARLLIAGVDQGWLPRESDSSFGQRSGWEHDGQSSLGKGTSVSKFTGAEEPRDNSWDNEWDFGNRRSWH